MLALKKRGYRVTAAASAGGEHFARAGIDFVPISFNRFVSPLLDFASIRGLSATLRRVNADIAHCFDTKLTVLTALAARAGVRSLLVRTINGRGWIFSSTSAGALALRRLYPLIQRLAARTTVATVFEHSGDKSFFVNHRLTGTSDAVVIPGAGIDVEGFETALNQGASRQALRAELGLGDAPVVTTVTRVTREKGIPALLKAAKIVHERRPDVKFLIVGPRREEGPFAISDDELAPHADYVIATGARSDIPALLRMSDIFAFPSEYAEGIPRALMEAALCGLPIVASAIDGCREVIRNDWNGVLTPLRDPAALAGNILSLIENPRTASDMAAHGPDLIRKTFCVDAIVARHADLYEKLLAERQHGAHPGTSAIEPRLAANTAMNHVETRPH